MTDFPPIAALRGACAVLTLVGCLVSVAPAQADDAALCADPAKTCGAVVAPECRAATLGSGAALGAGAIAAAPSSSASGSEASGADACAAQMTAYRDCLSRVVETCSTVAPLDPRALPDAMLILGGTLCQGSDCQPQPSTLTVFSRETPISFKGAQAALYRVDGGVTRVADVTSKIDPLAYESVSFTLSLDPVAPTYVACLIYTDDQDVRRAFTRAFRTRELPGAPPGPIRLIVHEAQAVGRPSAPPAQDLDCDAAAAAYAREIGLE